jgi:hypothetical protein
LAAKGREVGLVVDPAGNLVLLVRKKAAGPPKAFALGGAAGEVWLKLVRSGKAVTAYRSQDGVSWQALSTVATKLAPALAAGFVVASGDQATTAAATFSAASVTAAPPPPTNLTATRLAADGPIRLTWTHAAGSRTTFYVERSNNKKAGFATIATLTDTAFYEDQTSLAVKKKYFYRIVAEVLGAKSMPSTTLMLRA